MLTPEMVIGSRLRVTLQREAGLEELRAGRHIPVWVRRGQMRAFIIGPDGTTVLWQSPSGRWGTDISGFVFPN